MAVFNNEQIEGLRVLPDGNPAAEQVAQKMRGIVKRLLSSIDGEYDLNNFEFLVIDRENPNAFYVAPKNTNNGHDVVGITSGMVPFCKSEDEFAGIIAHELGHFKYDKIYGGGNTLFQERASDLHALQLMLDGGYDPAAYRDAAGRMSSMKDSALLSILNVLDVHGSPFARREDIDRGLTMLRKSRGGFPRADTKDWPAFQKTFAESFKDNRFQSYLDKIIASRAGGAGDAEHILEILAVELESGHIDTVPRANDLIMKLGDLFAARPLSESAMRKTQRLAEDIFYEDAALPEGIYHASAEIRHGTLERIIDLRGARLDLFGKFFEIAEDMRAFIDAENAEQAAVVAKIYRGSEPGYFNQYRFVFNFPKFEMPAEKNAVGKPLPYKKHMEWSRKNQDIRYFLRYVWNALGWEDKEDLGLDGSFISLKYPDSEYAHADRYDFAADDDGIIATVGHAAAEEFKRTKYRRRARLEKIRNNSERLGKKIEALNILSDFDQGKVSVEDPVGDVVRISLAMRLDEYRDRRTFNRSVFSDGYEVIEDNPNDKEDWEALRKSRGFRLLSESSGLQDKVAAYQDRITQGDMMKALLSPAVNLEFLQNASDIILRMIRELKCVPERVFRNFYNAVDEIEVSNLSFSAPMDSRLEAEIEKAFKEKQSAVLKKLTIESADIMEPAEWFDVFKYRGLSNVGDDNPLNPLVDIQLAKAGLFATDEETFYKILLDTGDKFGNIATARYMYKYLADGHPVTDIARFLQYAPNSHGEGFLKNALYDYAAARSLMPEDEFEKMLDVYIRMEHGDWLVESKSQQSRMLDKLVDKILRMPRAKREKYSLMLLTGDYGDENLNRVDKSLRLPEQKNALIDIFTDAMFEKIGRDDNSDAYLACVQEYIVQINKDVKFIRPFSSDNLRPRVAMADRARLFRILSDKIVSQERLSRVLESEKTVRIGDRDLQDNDKKGRIFQEILRLMEHDSKNVDAVMRFLNRRLSDESIRQFRSEINPHVHINDLEEKLSNQYLEIVHKTFWLEGLLVRTLLMGDLLNRYSPDIEKQIKYVLDMHFPKDHRYRKDAELVFQATIDALDEYQRNSILAAIASANENGGNSGEKAVSSVGAGLRMFFENMGPAWIKFGQLLSYVPELPSEIREDLAYLKDNADRPARWDLFEQIKNTLPEEIRGGIVSVDEVLGAGSFWITAKITMRNGGPMVLSMLRPNAAELSIDGFETIGRAIDNLAKADPKYKSLAKVVSQAKKSADYEVKVEHGHKQSEKARELYSNIRVAVDGNEFAPNVAEWKYYGDGYKVMRLANGRPLGMVADLAERRKMALAYFAIEIASLFKGDVWDIDRHQGQQHFEKIADGKYAVNIFDTGAQMPKAPGKKDKKMMVKYLYNIVGAIRAGRPLNQALLKNISDMDKQNGDTSYAADVQKGLMALSDIIEYQKEVKDKETGAVVRPRLSLSPDELEDAIKAVVENPSMDKTIRLSLSLRALPDRLFSAAKTLGHAKHKNPVSVKTTNARVSGSAASKLSRAADELERLRAELKAEEILGIKRKYIKHGLAAPEANRMPLRPRAGKEII
ncbi:MAG: M48 family metalloprotease [Rickettsiales bacterium]|jgi:hypothetical protein|nr:M48 family metalloprotease [Rickettsiales bacterium]